MKKRLYMPIVARWRSPQSVCGPGANVNSVWYRASRLQILSAIHKVEITDAVFKIPATLPTPRVPIRRRHPKFVGFREHKDLHRVVKEKSLGNAA
jgi:hypothetical protein